MSNKRRFTNEEIEVLVKRSEEISIEALSRETKISRNTLYHSIGRYKKEKRLKKEISEMQEQGMEISDICKKLKIGLEEGEYILALIEGRKPKRVRRAWTEEQKQEIWKLQCNGVSPREIAIRFSTTPVKIYCILEKHRVKLLAEVMKMKEEKATYKEIFEKTGLTKEEMERIKGKIREQKIQEKKEYMSATQANMITKPREKYKGPSIAELNKQAKMHNLTYGQYIAMKEMGLCQES